MGFDSPPMRKSILAEAGRLNPFNAFWLFIAFRTIVLVTLILDMLVSQAGLYGSGISLRHLKAMLYVVENKSVTRAALGLNRSQTTITKAISELESVLDTRLFDRTSTGMAPTVYGEVLSKRVRMVVDEFEKAGAAYQEYRPQGRPHQSIPVFSLDISHKRLEALVAIYEERDITSAAHVLGLSKTAVYNSLRYIEELLDLPLFQREPHGVTPTGLASTIVAHVKLAFSQIDQALDDIANLNGVTQGRVVIGTLPYTRTYLVPVAINRLLQDYPQIDVVTHGGAYNVLESSLRCGDVDFIVGALRDTRDRADIVTEQLLEDRLSVIARKGHPLAQREKLELKDLQDSGWVLPARGSPSWQLFDETLNSHNMSIPAHAVETSSLSMVRGLLLDSDRVALLSKHQIFFDVQFGILDALPVEIDGTDRPIGITQRAHTKPSPAAELFLGYLRQVAIEVRNQSFTDV